MLVNSLKENLNEKSVIDNDGREFVGNQGFTYDYQSNGEMHVTRSESYHKAGAFSTTVFLDMVELPKGSLLRLLGYNPERMVQGVLPDYNEQGN